MDVLPTGSIILWFGDKIPEGYVICDGTRNTPNLCGLFVIGAGKSFKVHSKGGKENHTHDNKVTIKNSGEHTHKFPNTWYGNYAEKSSPGKGNNVVDWNRQEPKSSVVEEGTHTHTASAKIEEGSNMPPYMALYYIMKT